MDGDKQNFFWNKRGLLGKKFASVLGNKMLDLKRLFVRRNSILEISS